MGCDTPSGYVPIACIAHERLEYAVLRRRKLRIRLRDENGVETELTVLPTDVTTRDKAEWLCYQSGEGNSGVVRLDRILAFEYL